jgi:hypothetical protein
MTRGADMSEWEYRKIDLNDLPRKMQDIDLLNAAGGEGWEVITIMPNNIAYLKRQIGEQTSRSARSSSSTTPVKSA